MNHLCTLQARLAITQDRLRRKILDNQLRLIGNATDCIKLKVNHSYDGDHISWDVMAANLIQVIFPPLRDVPFRRIKLKEGDTWELTSLVNEMDDGAQEHYIIQVPYRFSIDVGDLIFKVFLDEDQPMPIIIAIQVQELLGTFGGGKMIMQKCKCTIPTENFPQDVINSVKLMADRRIKVGF